MLTLRPALQPEDAICDRCRDETRTVAFWVWFDDMPRVPLCEKCVPEQTPPRSISEIQAALNEMLYTAVDEDGETVLDGRVCASQWPAFFALMVELNAAIEVARATS